MNGTPINIRDYAAYASIESRLRTAISNHFISFIAELHYALQVEASEV